MRNAHIKVGRNWFDLNLTIDAIEDRFNDGEFDEEVRLATLTALNMFRVNPQGVKWLPDLTNKKVLVEFDVWFEEFGVEVIRGNRP